MHTMEGNAFLFTKLYTKLLICIGLCSTQVEIAMYGLYTIAQFLEQQQQRNTIRSSRKRHQVHLLKGKQVITVDKRTNTITQHTIQVPSDILPPGDRY